MNYFLILVAMIAAVVALITTSYISLWFQAFVSGTPISLFNIMGMSLRKIPPRLIVSARITAFKAGLKNISASDLETHRISKLVLEKGLDAQTAFEILSIDIADLTIGENVGARLRADQAESDMRVARATAEERRAMAVAEEQENSAKVRAAEAQVPLAMAQALLKGRLGVLDYQRYQNIKADTSMREAIARDAVQTPN